MSFQQMGQNQKGRHYMNCVPPPTRVPSSRVPNDLKFRRQLLFQSFEEPGFWKLGTGNLYARSKDHFDQLYSFRRAIERRLGCGLSWDRMEGDKVTKVYLELTGLDLYDRTAWPQIADFHVNWCRKFYDVFLSYVSFIIQNG